MKVGDLVKWIGFPGASPSGVKITGPGGEGIGIIVCVHKVKSKVNKGIRIDVLWSNNKVGTRLYPQTVEVVNESR